MQLGLAAGVGLLLIFAGACRSHDPVAVKAEAIRRGDELVEKKQYAQAAAAYRVATAVDARDGHLRVKLANTYVLAGDATQACTEAGEAAKLLPGDVDAQLQAATLGLAQGRYQDAADRMAVFLRDHPDHAGAQILLGNAKARLYNSTWAMYALADAVRNPDDYERVRHDLRPIGPERDDIEAELAFRKALELAPTTTEARLAFVNFLWATGRLDEGEEMLRRLADEMPGHAAVTHALGGFYLSRHREADGERYLLLSAASPGYGARARFALVDHYVETDRDADALKILNEMTPADDASGAVSVRLAAIEFRAGNREEAMRRVDGLLARKAPRALLLKAQFLLAMPSPNREALGFARAAVGEDAWSSEARSALGQALVATGDLESARKEYLEAVTSMPAASRLRVELAEVLVELRSGSAAVLYARDAVKRLPDDLEASVVLVEALKLMKDDAAAEQGLKRLRARYGESPDALIRLPSIPENAMYRYYVGAGYQRAGELKRARAALARALQIDPSFKYADQARAVLASNHP